LSEFNYINKYRLANNPSSPLKADIALMDTRQELDSRAAGSMLILCMIWGLQQAVLKLAAPDIAPIMLIALRSGLAALLDALAKRAARFFCRNLACRAAGRGLVCA
jgi:hypothetical protein